MSTKADTKQDVWAVLAAIMLEKPAHSWHIKHLVQRVEDSQLARVGDKEYSGGDPRQTVSHELSKHKIGKGGRDVFVNVSRGWYRLNEPSKVKDFPAVRAVEQQFAKLQEARKAETSYQQQLEITSAELRRAQEENDKLRKRLASISELAAVE